MTADGPHGSHGRHGPHGRHPREPSPIRFYRDPANGPFLGVCAGIADYFDVPPMAVRLGAVFGLFFFTLPTIVAYLLAGVLVDAKPAELYANEQQEEFWRRVRVEPGQTVGDLGRKFRDIERRIRNAEAYVTSSEFKLNRDFKEL
jgi:phage shock protein C